MGSMGAGAKSSTGLARRAHWSASGFAGSQHHVSGWSPACSFWDGVWGNRRPPPTLAAQFKAPGTAWTAQWLTVTLRGSPGDRKAGLTGPSTEQEGAQPARVRQARASLFPGAPI